MKDKYWRLIIVIIILLAGLLIFLSYINTIEKYSKIGYEKGYKVGYDNKTCEICEDNEEKICACVYPILPDPNEVCKGRTHLMCVGQWEIRNDECYWNCEAK